MLAYRHAFHAGNHADVLKHTVLGMVLRYLTQKEGPLRHIDTHAGAGGYSLEGQYAQKKEEFQKGIARLWGREDLPAPVADYIAQIKAFNPGKALTQYPGSPSLALQWLRPIDQLRLFELHPTDERILRSAMDGYKNVQVHHGDGFEGLKGQLPPSSKRACILIDPPYEGTADYRRVVAAVRDALKRFAPAVIMVWYPQVQKVESSELPRRLQALAPKGWLHARLTVQKPDVQGFGLAGSGMFIFNPPWTLKAELDPLMPWLCEQLSQYEGSSWLLDQRAS